MTRNRGQDEFEGIDLSGPWGGIRIGTGARGWGDAWDEDDEMRRVRHRVRRRLDFYRHLTFYVCITGGLALLDGLTGDGWWVQWLAIIWGAFLAMQFLSTFVSPVLWGPEAEERMVQGELRRTGRRYEARRSEDAAAQPAEDGKP
jgi:hypothetical protein